jgi:hypothetical protein
MRKPIHEFSESQRRLRGRRTRSCRFAPTTGLMPLHSQENRRGGHSTFSIRAAGPGAWGSRVFARVSRHEEGRARHPRSVNVVREFPGRGGALLGSTEAHAFFIRCDRTTMTQDDILNGRLICEIGIDPVRPAEFVLFRIFQHTGRRSPEKSRGLAPASGRSIHSPQTPVNACDAGRGDGPWHPERHYAEGRHQYGHDDAGQHDAEKYRGDQSRDFPGMLIVHGHSHEACGRALLGMPHLRDHAAEKSLERLLIAAHSHVVHQVDRPRL